MFGINKVLTYFGLVHYSVGDKVIQTVWDTEPGEVLPDYSTRYGTVERVQPMTTGGTGMFRGRILNNPIIWAKFSDGEYSGFHARDTDSRKANILERLIFMRKFPSLDLDRL